MGEKASIRYYWFRIVIKQTIVMKVSSSRYGLESVSTL